MDGVHWNRTFNLQDLKVLEDENQVLKAEIESMKYELSIVQSGKKAATSSRRKKNHPFIPCFFSNQKVIKQCTSLWDALKVPGAKRAIKGVLVSEVHRVDEVSKERRDLRDQGAIEVISNNDNGL